MTYRLRKDLGTSRVCTSAIIPSTTSNFAYVRPPLDAPAPLRHLKQSHPSSPLVSKRYSDFMAACSAWTAEKDRVGKGSADILHGTSMTKAYALIAALHEAAPDYYPPGTPGLEGRTSLGGAGGREGRAPSPARFMLAPQRTPTGELVMVQLQQLEQLQQELRALTPDPTPPTVAPSLPSSLQDDDDHWSTPLPMTTTITTTTTTTTIVATPIPAPPAVRTVTFPSLSSTSVPSRRVRNIISSPPYLDEILLSSSSSSTSLTSTARQKSCNVVMEFTPYWPKPPSEKEMVDGEGQGEGEGTGEGEDGGSVELITDLLLDSTAAVTEMASSWIPSTTTSVSSSTSLPASSSSPFVTLKFLGTSTRVTVVSGAWGTTYKRYTLYSWEACFADGGKRRINMVSVLSFSFLPSLSSLLPFFPFSCP